MATTGPPRRLQRRALAAGIDPLTAIDEGFVPGLRYVGDQFAAGEMFLPEMMIAARTMQKAVAVLEPEMTRRAVKREVLGRVVIGTVKGDIHEIGKNLVAMMLSASGFEVHDLGVDVAFERFAEKAPRGGRRHRGRVRPADHDHDRAAGRRARPR